MPLAPCLFPQLLPLSQTPPRASFIPASPSPSPALIPSLPAHAVVLSSLSFSFSPPCFSFLPSPLLLACVLTCFMENITSFYIFLCFILAAFCLCSLGPFSPSPLLAPYPFLLPSPPSDHLPRCRMVTKAHEAKPPFLFTPPPKCRDVSHQH